MELGTRYLKSSGAAATWQKKQQRCRLSLLKQKSSVAASTRIQNSGRCCLCTTLELRTNFVCQPAEGRVRSFDKSDIIEKNTIRNQLNQYFVKLFSLFFHLSAFEVTFIKTSNTAFCRQKEFVLSLKVVQFCTQMTLSYQSFSSQSLLGSIL